MSNDDMVRLPVPDGLELPLGEALFTQRAIRRLDSNRPVSDEHIELMLNAASKAPNGGNQQPTRYLVIRDRQLITDFGALYHEAWWAKRRDAYGWTSKDDIPEGSVYRMPALLADEIKDAPLVILVFSAKSPVAASSTFPGVQNLLLAARGLGIGSVLTTLHACVMERVYAKFEIPADQVFHCCVPMGYPRGNFGPTSRLPTSKTTHWNSWGTPPPWS